MFVDQLEGQLVVLKSRWNVQSNRVGLILNKGEQNDIVLVMWTNLDGNGVKLKYHLVDALVQVNEITSVRIKERICDIK